MNLGVTLPTSGPWASRAAIVDVARAAERLGYAGVWTHERLLCPLGDVPQAGGPPRPLPDHYRSTLEPLETLALVAAHTERVQLGTSVLVAPLHAPIVLARRLATLDQLSGGRVIAGLGQGWIDQEYVATGSDSSQRGPRLEEAVNALRAAWGPDPVAFTGRFHSIPPSAVNPKPCRPEGIPILVGAISPAAIARAARVADGLHAMAFSLRAVRGMMASFRAGAARAGRDPAGLRVMVRANVPIRSSRMVERPFLGGSPEQVAGDLEPLAELGVEQVFFTNLDQPPIPAWLRLMERLRAAAERHTTRVAA